jgi:uncharacterized protein YndB with AHSA1/START domain
VSRRYVHEAVVDLPPERLFAAITDVRRWPEWDAELASTEQDGTPLRPGSRFTLKPKGGPRVAMTVDAIEAPTLFVDVAHLPLARMRTAHNFERLPNGTRVRVTIETTGPLAFLWDRLVARKQAAGAAEQTRRFAEFARTL